MNLARIHGRRTHHRSIVLVSLVATTALFVFLAGCAGLPGSSGSFERTLHVTGPVRLELSNGSGGVQVRRGADGEVRIHAEVLVRAWPWENVGRRLDEITSHPPIEQAGNLIRVGYEEKGIRLATFHYSITVPSETELQSRVGSGRTEVRGIRGPIKMKAGSGGISADDIQKDAQATAGSGGINLARVGGDATATAGSGGIVLDDIRGNVNAKAGSGGIRIADVSGRVIAKAGSGGVAIHGAGSDLRVAAGAGGITITGDPAPSSYWNLRTGSGNVHIEVTPSASFRLHARSGIGRIRTELPIVVEEQSKRDLRARVGSGAAHIEAVTGSGSIQIR